ncbi:type II secretory pathway, ATPase PulE/Tfp pilus assembly pathway, ATPase PilB [Calothrix sp. PCC 6303]|uniref:type II secretory pathway, ATPase PulE/Tfp pilus assembly pathway, ATPase PilB n=1 Tax=Calothrix sp. PCC 6303 TaxID=1170562 RepID=UPI00031C99E0|nr:type II secretory pathway, ATPase PulE/Tfp pilus assembly pathway, ATPase PilB [Calothrix sp. PCC 6303]
MLSSEGKGKSTDTEANHQQAQSSANPQQEELEQIFYLLDNLLSFEACLYHQILPLRLQGDKLLVGMVNVGDHVAQDYVNQILSYVKYKSLITPITDEAHRGFLSTYLSCKNTEKSRSKSEVPQSKLKKAANSNINSSSQEASFTQTNQQPIISSQLPTLSIPISEELIPLELLPTLPPKQFLGELLARVIVGGIGRLYFERLPYQGRILWSENGVLQSVLEKLPLSVFQGAINEVKKFANLPVGTLTEAKQVEKEYLYQQKRLLLRLRFMPGMYGEEATLQVLKGAALKFYQKQQISRLSRDAVSISQQLRYKLHELQEQMLQNPNVSNEQIESLTVLNRLLSNLDSQIKTFSDSEEEIST